MPRSSGAPLDQKQARKIAEECYGEVLAYCRRHAPAGHEAQDLAQETFLRFTRAQGYRDQGRPIAYLMRVARNVCIDASRNKRLETVQLDFDIAEQDDGIRAIELDAVLALLPDESREALELRYGVGLGMSELASVLKISRFAARRRVNSALRLLKAELEEDD